jgi:hypothetical protein
MSVPARISEVGRQLAEAQFLFAAAKEHREKEEAFLYQAARLQLEEGAEPVTDAKGKTKDPKPPTEAQVQALMRTDEVLAPRRDAAVMQEAMAEARYEALRADYRAVCTEADMVAESARNTRQELQNLDPTVRLAQLGRSWPRAGCGRNSCCRLTRASAASPLRTPARRHSGRLQQDSAATPRMRAPSRGPNSNQEDQETQRDPRKSEPRNRPHRLRPA